MNTPPISKVNFLPHDDCLRFVQRVLESDAPKQDREEALTMVRNMRKAIWDEDNTLAKVEAQRDELLRALKKISSIKNQMHGSDWDEIEQARGIAKEAIAKAQASEPAPREWVGLTTDEMKEVADRYHLKPPNVPAAFRAIEAKLKELNHG
jgi:hypothetical protein